MAFKVNIQILYDLDGAPFRCPVNQYYLFVLYRGGLTNVLRCITFIIFQTDLPQMFISKFTS